MRMVVSEWKYEAKPETRRYGGAEPKESVCTAQVILNHTTDESHFFGGMVRNGFDDGTTFDSEHRF